MAAKPGEYKTVQARILASAQEIGFQAPPVSCQSHAVFASRSASFSNASLTV